MDRELLLLMLILLVPAPLAVVFGLFPLRSARRMLTGVRREREAWRRLWYPLLPSLFTIAALIGWAVREPADAERLPVAAVLLALTSALLLVRVLIRASHTLRIETRHDDTGTVGIIRSRIVISPTLCRLLDDNALQAVITHERAHASHRDPFRIWLALLATELQGRSAAASHRCGEWRHALELARDEEARQAGVDGSDLAAAILEAVKIRTMSHPAFAPLLTSDQLEDRIHALLAPLAPAAANSTSRFPAIVIVCVALMLAAITGGTYGEHLISAVSR